MPEIPHELVSTVAFMGGLVLGTAVGFGLGWFVRGEREYAAGVVAGADIALRTETPVIPQHAARAVADEDEIEFPLTRA